jgi:hypothetical protein
MGGSTVSTIDPALARHQAEQALNQAKLTGDPQIKKQWLELAEAWLDEHELGQLNDPRPSEPQAVIGPKTG